MPHSVRSWAATLALVATSIAPLAAQQPERFELTGTNLKLYNLIGTLRVEAASGSTASAEISRQGADGPHLTVRNTGGTLAVVYPGNSFVYPALGGNHETTVRVRDDGTFNDDWDGNGGRKVRISSRGDGLSAWADLRVLVPAGAHLDLNIGMGKVTLANVNGAISVETSAGDVQATATAGALSIATGSGAVTVGAHKGDLSVDTGSGDIRITGLTGTQLKVDTGSGDIVVTGAAVRGVHVDTGSGNIRLGLTADVDDLSVDTGSGDVEVIAPGSLGVTVNIETSSGDINTEFPLQVTRKGRDGLSGTIGNGQGTMSLETASGNVTLRKQP